MDKRRKMETLEQQGARMVLEEVKKKLRQSVHPKGCEEGKTGDLFDGNQLAGRIREHCENICKALDKWDEARSYYKRVHGKPSNETEAVIPLNQKGKINEEVHGHFAVLSDNFATSRKVFCLVTDSGDISTITDLIEYCGYKEKDLWNKRVIIHLLEDTD